MARLRTLIYGSYSLDVLYTVLTYLFKLVVKLTNSFWEKTIEKLSLLLTRDMQVCKTVVNTVKNDQIISMRKCKEEESLRTKCK